MRDQRHTVQKGKRSRPWQENPIGVCNAGRIQPVGGRRRSYGHDQDETVIGRSPGDPARGIREVHLPEFTITERLRQSLAAAEWTHAAWHKAVVGPNNRR